MSVESIQRPFPTDFEREFAVLVPGAGMGETADAHLQELARHGFVVARGLHIKQAGHLTAIANDEKVQEFCPNDKERFGSVEAQRAWVAKNTGRAALGIYHVYSQTGPVDLSDASNLTVDDVVQIAIGWGGQSHNKYLPSADITTGYRVSSEGSRLARESRIGLDDHFSLGFPLGYLTIENLVRHYRIARNRISLETWDSNERAKSLYEKLGFREVDGVSPEEAVRPTLKPIGTNVNGHVVYGREVGDGPLVAEVLDYRVFEVLSD